jgi:hypothetical protein
MQNPEKTCHGQINGLIPPSEHTDFGLFYKIWRKLRLSASHLRWHFQNKSASGFIKYIFLKLLGSDKAAHDVSNQGTPSETLDLQPGEWVEVKSEAEILATLDEKGNNKGLHWMRNMRDFCGKKFRVYKRLERILIESTGECRKMKNTVLLEGVTCDGEEWYGCDRSCYHFWREVWLKRVSPHDHA